MRELLSGDFPTVNLKSNGGIFPTVNHKSNGHDRHRRRARIRAGHRLAALRAQTGAELVEERGISIVEAARRSGSCPQYVKAMLVLRASENIELIEAVLAGDVPVLEAAKAMKIVAKMVSAVRKASVTDLEVFSSITGMWHDPVEALIRKTKAERADIGRRLSPEWTWDNLIMPAMVPSEPIGGRNV
jgi:hypothetical protein